MHIIKLFNSFSNAFDGIKILLKEQNFRIHLIATIVVALFAFYLNFNYLEWGLVLLCIGFVIALEAINTAIEKICDLISKEESLLIKQIKDVSASAVLIQAIISLIIAMIILNKIFDFIAF